MIITIEATLSDEQCLIIAKEKWYQELIQKINTSETEVDWVITVVSESIEIKNTESPGDFLQKVYQWLIISDVSKIFIDIENKILKEKQTITEQIIKDNVSANISSSIKL